MTSASSEVGTMIEATEQGEMAVRENVVIPVKPPGPTSKQRRIIRRAKAYHRDGVAYRSGQEAFSSGQQAVCYALAVKACTPTCRVAAGRMVADLLSDKDVGIVTYASRQTDRRRNLQRRGLGHLEGTYGYRTDPDWCARLNEAVETKLSRYDNKERMDFALDPKLYRAVILNPLMFGRKEGRR